MPLATTLRLLAKARGMTATDLATAIPRAGVETVSAWMRGETLPGKQQLDALARTLGVPAGALLAQLAAYRAMSTRHQGALLEIARGLADGSARDRPARDRPAREKPAARKPARKK